MAIPRHRSTEPIGVRLYKAREHLADSRERIDNGRPVLALFSIMHAVLNLQRVEERLNNEQR